MRWSRPQDHGSHLLLFGDTAELLTGDYDAERGAEQAVILDIATGRELARVDTGSGVQSVLFPAAGLRPRRLHVLLHLGQPPRRHLVTSRGPARRRGFPRYNCCLTRRRGSCSRAASAAIQVR